MMLALKSILVAYFALVFSRLPWLVKAVGPLFARTLQAGLPGAPTCWSRSAAARAACQGHSRQQFSRSTTAGISRLHLARCTGLETCVLPVRPY